jgi:hypothetical protein
MTLVLELLQRDLEALTKMGPQSEYYRGMAEGLRSAIALVSDQLALDLTQGI